MSIRVEASVCSNMGRVRKNNEDNFFFNGFYMDETRRDSGGVFTEKFARMPMLFAVCDGMGGTASGEEASLMAVKMLGEFAQQNKKIDDSQVLGPALQKISDAIEDRVRGSGTTIVMVTVRDNAARIVHVGDSRCYTFFSGKLACATVDHSEVQRLYSMGTITRDEMATHPKRHMINQFLGMPREEAMIAPSYSDRIPLREGMRFLLCSDGLTDMVDDATIEMILASNADPKEASKALVQTALSNGGKDNVTVMCLNVTNSSDDADDTLVNNRSRKNKSSDRVLLGKGAQLMKKICAGGMLIGAIGLLASLIMLLT